MSDVKFTNKENKDTLLEHLQLSIPESINIEFPSNEALFSSGENSIQEANNKAQIVILKLLKDNEEERRKRRKPVLILISVLVVLQLVAFNAVIGGLVLGWWRTNNIEIATELLNFLKYYIGAVLVELRGMLAVITTDTFKSYSESLIKMITSNIWGGANKFTKLHSRKLKKDKEVEKSKESDENNC